MTSNLLHKRWQLLSQVTTKEKKLAMKEKIKIDHVESAYCFCIWGRRMEISTRHRPAVSREAMRKREKGSEMRTVSGERTSSGKNGVNYVKRQ
jgi:hypothetical protein